MNSSAINLERYSESTERAQQYWTAQHREQETHDAQPLFHGLTIAITREAGTPGTSVAREVGQRLDWKVYDRELVNKIAHDMGLRPSALESVDEKPVSWLLESLAGLSSRPGATEGGFVRHLVQSVVSLGKEGRCVIVGRGAAQILPAATTLRVRLVGLLEDRIAAASKRLNISREQAERWVVESDRERCNFAKSHFGRDPQDMRLYDMVLNTSRWTVPECADIIVQALRDFEKHPAAVRALHAGAKS
jgi:cytidylate kinase